ncbi:hypothetical protein Tco_0836162 [Tanacetum coccineum]
MEVDEVMKKKDEFETDEEIKEIIKEEEDDEDGKNFNLFPTMEEQMHHEKAIKEPSTSVDEGKGEERGPEPPIKPHSLDSFRMKEVDSLTINTSPSPHVASSHPKNTLYLMRKSLEVLRKFHWMILGGRFNQLSHVSSPLLSKPGEY